MVITENVNLNAKLEITDADGIVKPVLSANCNLAKDGGSFSFNFLTIDLVTLESNVTSAQTEMNNFIATVNSKLVELGYKVTI